MTDPAALHGAVAVGRLRRRLAGSPRMLIRATVAIRGLARLATLFVLLTVLAPGAARAEPGEPPPAAAQTAAPPALGTPPATPPAPAPAPSTATPTATATPTPTAPATANPPAPPPARVLLETSLGTVELEVDLARAPVTARNFLRYVDAGRYDGGRFHRTVRADNQPKSPVKIAVVQAGVSPAEEANDFPPIPLERTGLTGLRHRDGTISMARAGPDTATSDFFVCLGDQPELDEGGRRNPDGQGFAAFGRVVRGMDVVRQIHAAPAEGQALAPAIRIVRARRASRQREDSAPGCP